MSSLTKNSSLISASTQFPSVLKIIRKMKSTRSVCVTITVLIHLLFMEFGDCNGSNVNSRNDSCFPRKYGDGKIVCVCNVTHCDFMEPISNGDRNKVYVIESNKDGARFEVTSSNVNTLMNGDPGLVIKIDRNSTFQSLLGFGAAFTDSAGITTTSLGAELTKLIIDSYWSSGGLQYTVGRIVIGGCDFSPRKYTYDDDADGDMDLNRFNLTQEDFEYKIPLIKLAIKSSPTPEKVKFFASAWSAPAWMKTNGDLAGAGMLKGSPGSPFYKTWAKYYVRFLEEYKKVGIQIWGLTTGNEPLNGFIPFFKFNCMAFTPQLQRDFIKLDLGPALAAAGYGHVKLMILDDQRYLLPGWADVVLADPVAASYVSGIGFHWYGNNLAPASTLDHVHKSHPDKFLLSTEATEGSSPFELHHVILGSWDRAENYARDIISDLNHWTTGWIDWNYSLNEDGGPQWPNNPCDAPIIVNASAQEFYKQPTFYALGHFSKFIPPDSVRVDMVIERKHLSSIFSHKLDAVSFVTPSGSSVTVILNGHDHVIPITFLDVVNGVKYKTQVSARSITTIVN